MGKSRTTNPKPDIPPPSMLGDTVIDPEAWLLIPAPERAAIIRIQKAKFDPIFWDFYAHLRSREFEPHHAAIGAWAAMGRGGKAQRKTQDSIAALLGIHRQQVAQALRSRGRLAAAVVELRAAYWADRIPDIDEAAYRAATAADGTAADRKLAYQRAGILIGEDAGLKDDWLSVLNQAYEDANEDANDANEVAPDDTLDASSDIIDSWEGEQ